MRLLTVLVALGVTSGSVVASAQVSSGESSASLPFPPSGGNAPQVGKEESGVGHADEQTALQQEILRLQQMSQEFSQARLLAPERLREVNDALSKLSNESMPVIDPAWTLDQLAFELALAEQELAQLLVEQSELDAEPERRAKRRKSLPALIADAHARARDLQTTLASDAVDPGSRDLIELRLLKVRSEIEAYENELKSYDARGALLSRRREHAARLTENKRKIIVQLRSALQIAQRDQVRRDAERARELVEEVAALPPGVRQAVQELAEKNLALTDLWAADGSLIEEIGTIDERLAWARAKVFSVQTELLRLKAKVDAAGLADSVGTMLREERANAPDVGMYRRFVQMRADKIDEAELQRLRLNEQRDQLADVESRVREALNELDDSLESQEKQRIDLLLRELFTNQRKYMDALISDHEDYFQKLVEFDTQQRELIEHSERLISFINERVLWVPSGRPFDSRLPSDLMKALDWLTGGRYWKQLGRACVLVFKDRIGTCLSLLFLLCGFVLLRRKMQKQLSSSARLASASACTSFGPTAKALLLSLALGAAIPLLVFYFFHILSRSPGATQFARCFAHGAGAATLFWATLGVLRQLLRDGGVAIAHLGWPGDACLRLRHHLSWFSFFGVPLVFLMFIFELRADDAMRESLARLAFLSAMIGTALLGHLTLRPSGALREILVARGALFPGVKSPSALFQRLLHYTSIGLPLALIVAAAVGFYWTALQFAVRQHLSLSLFFSLILSSDLLRRAIAIAQRNIAVARLEEVGRSESRLEDDTSHAPQADDLPAEVGESLDLATVSEQTRRLTSSALTLGGLLGLGAIWADLLPAAGILREVELWHVQKHIEPSVETVAGAKTADVVQWVAVSLADVAVALVIVVVGFVLLRNLPGLLEVTLFRRLHAGERYAFATILKYAIAVTGLTLALGSLGLSWGNIQWLVAAIGLGLGFGLQEIFANFISGILILLERPIRVGDTVTVGDVSGSVTRIHIRATWITTFDRKELVVPNKEFVTSKLINWSLSDPTLRLSIRVGIAYGSDIQRAEKVLYEAAARHQQVLREPPPRVLFLEFGDSALGFELQVYVGDPDHRLGVVHDLHKSIDAAFREADIEIAFPQREIRIKGPVASSAPSLANKDD